MSSNASDGLNRRLVLGALATLPALPALFGATIAEAQTAAADPLPSWNNRPAKQGILEFIRATTSDPSSATFVPPEERVATFDQDGTLWVEHPIYTQFVYCLDRVPVASRRSPRSRTSSHSRPCFPATSRRSRSSR